MNNSEMSAGTAADKSGADDNKTSSHSSANTTVGSSVQSTEKYHTAFDNLNHLNEMILDKAHQMLKRDIEEDNALIRKNLQGKKPEHFTDEEWEHYKSLGERLLKL